MNKYLAEPRLAPSQLQVRMGLARNRLHAFPLDDMNFLFNNIERLARVHCHAHQCTGDLIGRILNAFSFVEGIDGKKDPYLEEIYVRMLRQVQKYISRSLLILGWEIYFKCLLELGRIRRNML